MSGDSSPNAVQAGPRETHAADEAEGEGGAEVAAGGAAGRAVTFDQSAQLGVRAGVRRARTRYVRAQLLRTRAPAPPAGRNHGVYRYSVYSVIGGGPLPPERGPARSTTHRALTARARDPNSTWQIPAHHPGLG